MTQVRLAAPNVVIESYNIPSSARAKEYVDFDITGHVTSAGDNAGVAFAYVDGPAPSIIVNYQGTDYEISKGRALAVYRSGASDACTRITMDAKVKYPEEGTYTVWALAGYVDVERGVFYYTDKREVTVEVTAPPPEVASLSGVVTQNIAFGLVRRPHAGATVELNGRTTLTAPDGSYSFTDIPVGTYTLTVYPTSIFGGHSQSVSLTAGANTKDVEVGVRWEVTVVGAVGAVIGGFAIAKRR